MKRIKVIGTGCQAPYGIGEIISDFAPTIAGARKAFKAAEKYYNRPTIKGAMIINDKICLCECLSKNYTPIIGAYGTIPCDCRK